MTPFETYTPDNKPNSQKREEIIDFLYSALQEYGDPKSYIDKCLQFCLKETTDALGGFTLVLNNEEGRPAGMTIVNRTGMEDYVPENILVYIAVDPNQRKKGFGKKLMNKALEIAEGDVALHVEADNPAIRLYESTGYTNKYLEMRHIKK